MESKAQAPAGGFKCTIPVSKTGPTSASAGETVTWTIKVPSDPDALLGLNCDLVNITVVDTIKTIEGNASGTITTISGQGKSAAGNGKTATLTGLGPYKVGDPPIEVKVTATLTGAGRLENIADVTANLANCGSGGLGGQITGFADLAKVTGTAEVLGTAKVTGTGSAGGTSVAVLAQRLPTTGGSTGLTFLGIGAMLTAAGVYLFNRKASGSTS
jgi:LPXTG-motif cell wall-anchored protein